MAASISDMCTEVRKFITQIEKRSPPALLSYIEACKTALKKAEGIPSPFCFEDLIGDLMVLSFYLETTGEIEAQKAVSTWIQYLMSYTNRLKTKPIPTQSGTNHGIPGTMESDLGKVGSVAVVGKPASESGRDGHQDHQDA